MTPTTPRHTQQSVWRYVEPGDDGEAVTIDMTEGQILAFYWDYWSQRMRELGERGINPVRCVEDWAVAFWAWRVGAEGKTA